MDQDFIHTAPCGCRVVYDAGQDYRVSRMESCGPHALRLRGIWRDAMKFQADDALEAWIDAGHARQAPTAGMLFDVGHVQTRWEAPA